MTRIDDIISDFELLDDWEDRYRYIIELGKGLPVMSGQERSEKNKVRGCVSQVWLDTKIENQADQDPILVFTGDSDAHIVRGLIAILFAMFSGKSARQILDIQPHEILAKLSLEDHLTPQRSNGLIAMVKRIKADAQNSLSDTGSA